MSGGCTFLPAPHVHNSILCSQQHPMFTTASRVPQQHPMFTTASRVHNSIPCSQQHPVFTTASRVHNSILCSQQHPWVDPNNTMTKPQCYYCWSIKNCIIWAVWHDQTPGSGTKAVFTPQLWDRNGSGTQPGARVHTCSTASSRSGTSRPPRDVIAVERFRNGSGRLCGVNAQPDAFRSRLASPWP